MTYKQMVERQRELLESAKAAGRAFTPDEQTEWDGLQRQIDAIQAQPHDTESREAVLQAERARVADITGLCRDFGVDAQSYINDGSTMDQVRAAILDGMKKAQAPVATNARTSDFDDENVRFARQASDGLMMRSGLAMDNPEAGAERFAHVSLRELLIECAERGGAGKDLHHLSNDELMRQYMTPESAFPAILDQTIEKAYKDGYTKVPVTFDKFTKRGSLSDFKEHDNYYYRGPVGEFLEVPESGELKHDAFTDAKFPKRHLKTYGRQFTLSRKAFIDDDISLVTTLPARYAAAARKTINTQVYKLLLSDAPIYDGNKLFGKEHHNCIKAGTGVTQEAMQTMIMALSNQTDQFGQPIIIRPATLVVPSGLKFEMYTLFNSPVIHTSDNTQAVNPMYQYRDMITVVEDPTINALVGAGKALPWFLFGEQSDVDGIEVDYLNGRDIPEMRRTEPAGQLGYVWDFYLDWGITVMDYRGMVKNPGIAVKSKLELE